MVSASHPLLDDLRWFLRQAHAPRRRSMREFAEAEVVIPDGPYAGRRFRCDRQPYTRLWFDEVDSGRWSRCVATGPTQSGKSLSCFVIPLLYHLFEIGETVICGLPDMDMAGDKWRESILPVIERSRYRKLLPRHGSGVRVPLRTKRPLDDLAVKGLVRSAHHRSGYSSPGCVPAEPDSASPDTIIVPKSKRTRAHTVDTFRGSYLVAPSLETNIATAGPTTAVADDLAKQVRQRFDLLARMDRRARPTGRRCSLP